MCSVMFSDRLFMNNILLNQKELIFFLKEILPVFHIVNFNVLIFKVNTTIC